jgi:HPr kinase/phosphorylase
MMSDPTETVHASCVALDARAILILGPSGSGKSALALTLMAYGAGVVADDRTVLQRRGASLIADAPPTIRGRIEARGIGILSAEPVGPARVVLAIDLGMAETERLPPDRDKSFLGIAVPCLHNPGMQHVPAAILQYLKSSGTD